MQGDSVRTLQAQLVERKLLAPSDATGVFGKKTLAAVRQFQAQQNLAVDGLVGPLTLGALEKKSWTAAPSEPVARPASGFQNGPEASAAPAEAAAPAPAPVTTPGLQSDAAAAQAAVRRAAMGGAPVAAPAAAPIASPAVPAPAPTAQVEASRVTADEALAALPPQARAELQMVLDGQAGSASQSALKGLLSTPGFAQLSPTGRKLMLEAVQPSNVRGSLANLGKLMATPAFQNVNEGDFEKLISVAKAGQTDALVALGPAVFAKDTKGTRLLDSVAQLATGPLQAELAKERPQLLAGALAEVMNPDSMLQRDHNTCSATTAEQLLARSNPAELMRLLAGLASPTGSVQLANNDTLSRAAGTERNDGSRRSTSQRLLQAAFMEYGNGAATYDNTRDVSVDQKAAQHMGLSHDEMAKLMSGVFGRPYEADSVHQKSGLLLNKSGGEIFDRLQQQKPLHDTMAVMRWDARGHVITVDRIADGRVYFRNPQGNDLPQGATYTDTGPARRSEGGIEQSMTVADFRERLMATVNPKP